MEPGYAIDASAFSVAGWFWEGAFSSGLDLRVQMEVRSVADDLLAVHILGDDPNDFVDTFLLPSALSAFAASTFTPQQKISVIVNGSVVLYGSEAVLWNQFRQDFRRVAVPEPSTALLASLGFLVIAWARQGQRNL